MEHVGNDRWRAHFTVEPSSASTSTPSKPGWIGSRPGGTSCRRSSAPARTSRASCSRAPRLFDGPARPRTACSTRRRRRSRTRPCRWSSVCRWRSPSRCAARWRARPIAAARRATTASLKVIGRTGARPLRRLVRDVSAVGRDRSHAQRDVRRGGRRGCPTSPAMGFDVALSAADSSDRPQLPQGSEQRARGADRTIPAARGRSDRQRADTTRSSLGSARSRTSIASSKPARAPRARDRARSRLPGVARSSLRARSIRSGFDSVPTARSSTRRTRRRNTRTSIRSISNRTTGRRSGTS